LNSLPSTRSIGRGLILFVAVAAVIATLLSTTGTSAHARLSAANPAPGSALAAAPATIQLTFTEPVDVQFSTASLVNANGDAVPIGTIQADPNDEHIVTVSVSDPAAMQSGNYTLIWRALSAADGHATDGVLSFSVGTGQAPTAASTNEIRENVPWWEVASSWLELAGLVAVCGFFSFALFVLFPALKKDEEIIGALGSPLRIAWWVGWLIALTGMLAVLLVQVSRVTGDSHFSWPDRAAVRQVLTGTRFGQCWLIRLGLMLSLAVLVAFSWGIPKIRHRQMPSRTWFWAVGLSASAAMLLTIPLSGHAAAVDPEWAGVTFDWLHLSAVAVWLGGLVYLVLALATLLTSANVFHALVGAELARRFSVVALFAIVAIICSGFVNAAFHVSGPRNLTTETYGLALVVKHLIFIVVLIAAAVNLLVTFPRLKRSAAAADINATRFFLRGLWITVALELGLAVGVLVAAAALSDLAPADGPLQVDVATKITSYDQHAPAGDLDVWLLGRIAGEPGDRLTLSVTDKTGAAPDNILRVILTTSASTATGKVSDRFDAAPLSGNPGTYVFPATRVGLAANWTIGAIVRRGGIPDETATFAIDTHGTGVQPPRLVADHWRLPRMAIVGWLTLALAIGIGIAGIVGIRKLPDLEPLTAALLLTMTTLIVAGFLVTSYRLSIPVSASTNTVNPIPTDDASIQRGATTYEARCLACHGATAAGVDAQTAAANPTHQHATSTDLKTRKAKQQRDGDLFDGISNGVPGTDMPAFDSALSNQERWDLVNYLRKLQNAGP
jgi:copper transport protein